MHVEGQGAVPPGMGEFQVQHEVQDGVLHITAREGAISVTKRFAGEGQEAAALKSVKAFTDSHDAMQALGRRLVAEARAGSHQVGGGQGLLIAKMVMEGGKPKIDIERQEGGSGRELRKMTLSDKDQARANQMAGVSQGSPGQGGLEALGQQARFRLKEESTPDSLARNIDTLKRLEKKASRWFSGLSEQEILDAGKTFLEAVKNYKQLEGKADKNEAEKGLLTQTKGDLEKLQRSFQEGSLKLSKSDKNLLKQLPGRIQKGKDGAYKRIAINLMVKLSLGQGSPDEIKKLGVLTNKEYVDKGMKKLLEENEKAAQPKKKAEPQKTEVAEAKPEKPKLFKEGAVQEKVEPKVHVGMSIDDLVASLPVSEQRELEEKSMAAKSEEALHTFFKDIDGIPLSDRQALSSARRRMMIKESIGETLDKDEAEKCVGLIAKELEVYDKLEEFYTQNKEKSIPEKERRNIEEKIRDKQALLKEKDVLDRVIQEKGKLKEAHVGMSIDDLVASLPVSEQRELEEKSMAAKSEEALHTFFKDIDGIPLSDRQALSSARKRMMIKKSIGETLDKDEAQKCIALYAKHLKAYEKLEGFYSENKDAIPDKEKRGIEEQLRGKQTFINEARGLAKDHSLQLDPKIFGE